MNKYQKALENVLKDNPKTQLTISDIHKDIGLLQELVDKETPMKVNQADYKIEDCDDADCDYFPVAVYLYKCPNSKCKWHRKYELVKSNKRCPECNQLLDWRK